MADYLSEWGRTQIKEHPVLADTNRHANRGDVLHFVLEDRLSETVSGIFVGFVERDGRAYIELHSGSAPPVWIDPTRVAVLQVIRSGWPGFWNDYRSREGQGAPKDGPSI